MTHPYKAAHGSKIVAALEDAARGNFSRVTIMGQVWKRAYPDDEATPAPPAQPVQLQPGWLKRDIERASARVKEWESQPAPAQVGEWQREAAKEIFPLVSEPWTETDIANIIAKHAPSAPAPDKLVEHAKRMSDALLKVRPLGGSELFVRIGDAFYADAEYCGQLIDQMRAGLHDARVAEIRAARAASPHPTSDPVPALTDEQKRGDDE